MERYIGIYYREKTTTVEEIIKNIKLENYETYMECGNVFLAIDIKRTEDEPSVLATDETVLLFSGICFNEQELVEKVSLDADVPFIEALEILYRKNGEGIFREIRGYFTLFIYDKLAQKAMLVRDQFGTNFLYYHEFTDGFMFADSKKAIVNTLKDHRVDQKALQQYLSFQYVPNPQTITENIFLVPSGNYVVFDETNQRSTKLYYDRSFHPVLTEKHALIKRIREALYDSVFTMMEGKTSIGSFLSGGIDSTFVAAIAKDIKPDLKTFSVGFEREGYSEIEVAQESAAKLGVENISKVITAEEYVDRLPEIIWHMEDPLADPACVPLYFVAREAKKHVDYALSGEGADEFFGGYNIYREAESLKMFNYIPSVLKVGLNKLAALLPDNVKGKSFLERGTTPLRDRYIGNAKIFEEDEKKSLLLNYDDKFTYRNVTQPFYERVADEPHTTQMQYIDIHTWLPGDILLKANKMSRANGLTVLMPFVDIRVFEVARELPLHYTIAEGTTKRILREAARGIVPDHVLARKKLGFPVPIRHWLKDELYDWAKTLIEESGTDEYLNKQEVLNMLERHASGKEDLSRKLWTVLIFMVWHQIFIEEKFAFQKEKQAINVS